MRFRIEHIEPGRVTPNLHLYPEYVLRKCVEIGREQIASESGLKLVENIPVQEGKILWSELPIVGEVTEIDFIEGRIELNIEADQTVLDRITEPLVIGFRFDEIQPTTIQGEEVKVILAAEIVLLSIE